MKMTISLILILILSYLMMITLNELKWKNYSKDKTMKEEKKLKKFFLSLFMSFDPKMNMAKYPFMMEELTLMSKMKTLIYLIFESWWRIPTMCLIIDMILFTMNMFIEKSVSMELFLDYIFLQMVISGTILIINTIVVLSVCFNKSFFILKMILTIAFFILIATFTALDNYLPVCMAADHMTSQDFSNSNNLLSESIIKVNQEMQNLKNLLTYTNLTDEMKINMNNSMTLVLSDLSEAHKYLNPTLYNVVESSENLNNNQVASSNELNINQVASSSELNINQVQSSENSNNNEVQSTEDLNEDEFLSELDIDEISKLLQFQP